MAIAEFIYPRGGWTRAFGYVRLRLRRLPGSPEFIARGLWAGVFTSFTPFYGLHFVVAAILAYIMRGSVFAALMGTFFGNPLTYVPIGVAAMTTGNALLGLGRSNAGADQTRSLGGKFVDAGGDLWFNFIALFTKRPTDWTGLIRFWDEVFFPYMIGGIIPGVICATICYYLAVPVIRAYQKRRKGRLRAKLAELKEKAVATAKADSSSTGD